MENLYSPATNLQEFIRNFNHNFPIDSQHQRFYVQIYDNPLIKRLKTYIINGQYLNQTFFVTGQSGSGKTSALLRTKRLIEQTGEFIGIHVSVSELDIEDINVIDLLIFLGFKLLTYQDLPKKISKKLERDFFSTLEKIKQTVEGTREEISLTETTIGGDLGIEAEAKAGGKFLNIAELGLKLIAKLELDQEIRQQVREVFKVKKDELLELINEVISEINSHFKNKKLVLFIDDIEKIRNEKSVSSLFATDLKLIKKINCVKVITFPLYAREYLQATEGEFAPLFFSLRITNPPYKVTQDLDKEAQLAREKLYEIVKKRVDPEYLDKLIDREAINLAIEKSGGNIKTYIMLLYNAAYEAIEDGKITENHVKEVINFTRHSISFNLLDGKLIRLLSYIKRHHFANDEFDTELIHEAIQSNLIYFYYNDEFWLDINPIIRDTIDRYEKNF